ncbi:fucose-binding lectin II [Paraburkholderia sediminicola]|uniref:fucose-binding lectin II n=1 Tax=Paraburkholderia sediminicola TaxID=458836 RepID=UPI0038BBD197
MSGNLLYGDTLYLSNQATFDDPKAPGYYLDVYGALPSNGGVGAVYAAQPSKRSGKSVTWKIEPVDQTKNGKPVKSGDAIVLRSMLEDNEEAVLATIDGNTVPVNEIHCVGAVQKNNTSIDARSKWKIGHTNQDGSALNDEGTPLNDGDTIYLFNCADNGYLDSYDRAGVEGEAYCVFTSSTLPRTYNGNYHTTSWKVIKAASEQAGGNGGDGKGNGGERNGIFNLPPNTAFGVTVLVNSAAVQTVSVYVDDASKPSATFTGSGTKDRNLQTQILNSGKGSVRVIVEANGKQSKLGSRQVDIFQKAYFGLVASEDGTDDDYNDGLVILNWPLG